MDDKSYNPLKASLTVIEEDFGRIHLTLISNLASNMNMSSNFIEGISSDGEVRIPDMKNR